MLFSSMLGSGFPPACLVRLTKRVGTWRPNVFQLVEDSKLVTRAMRVTASACVCHYLHARWRHYKPNVTIELL